MQRESRSEQDLKINIPKKHPPALFLPYIFLPLRSVAFVHLWWSYEDDAVCTHVIDRHDGFPEPIREDKT